MSMVSWGAIVDAGMGGGVPGRSAKVLLLLVVPVASGPVPVVVLELECVEGFDSRVMVEDSWEGRPGSWLVTWEMCFVEVLMLLHEGIPHFVRKKVEAADGCV